jgi:hypothetical protein
MKKSLFGNLASEPIYQSKRILFRFAVDNMLGYYNKETQSWGRKTKYFEVKIFSGLFEQFRKDKIHKGSGLEVTEYEINFEERVNKTTDEIYEVNELIIKDYKIHARTKDTAEEMVEKPKSKITLDKQISQYKPDENSEEDGDPAWMNE